MTSQPETPELDKRQKIMDKRRPPAELLTEFYDWLHEQGYVLARWHRDELHQHYLRPEQLFADFLGIDLDKIEKERRALLAWLHDRNTEAVTGP